ncbi:MAG: hypothetical protein HY898_34475 [Deltaproteobacteria bacterium]|nr:hypothetical protein [Deltaproteobacteria bacterium]
MPLQLVATLGPASLHLAPAIVAAGASALRLNASHMSPAALGAAIATVRAQAPDTTVIVDLQGAKMRLGTFQDWTVVPGDVLDFTCDQPPAGSIPIPHPELFRCVGQGDTLSIDDDRVRVRVVDAARTTLRAEVTLGGVLRPRKGVNVVEHPVALDDLTHADQEHVRVAISSPPIAFAISFMADGHEASWVRDRAPLCPVIGKIERQEAIAQLGSIQRIVDTVWICRGDLGAQLGPAALARWLAQFRPAACPPTLLAGQVLEHLTAHAAPTRSEVCHLFDVIQRGYAGIVLSDETAIGTDPVRAVRSAAELLLAFGA